MDSKTESQFLSKCDKFWQTGICVSGRRTHQETQTHTQYECASEWHSNKRFTPITFEDCLHIIQQAKIVNCQVLTVKCLNCTMQKTTEKFNQMYLIIVKNSIKCSTI